MRVTFEIERYTPEMLLDVGVFVTLKQINKGQHFNMASNVRPNGVLFMATSKRTPYRSYYLFMSIPFYSVRIVLYN